MKVLLISGHGSGDSGALGCGFKEADLNIEVVRGIGEHLMKYCTVDIYDTARNAFKDIQNGCFRIATDYDYAFECHFNAFNGKAKGTEVFVTSKEKSITVEQGIMKVLQKYFNLRDADGVKVTDYLVIRTLKNKGISSALLEMCFIDNKEDMKVYEEYKERIFEDIAIAIAKGFGIYNEEQKPVVIPKPETKPTITQIAKEVISGHYGNGAERTKNLKDAGHDPVEVQKEVNRLLGVKVETSTKIEKGDKVTFIKNVDYVGTHLLVSGIYDVIEVKKDRVVVGRGTNITAAVNINNLKKV